MSNLICPVCRDLLLDPQDLAPGTVKDDYQPVATFCGHVFHIHCLMLWFATEQAHGRQYTCPTCTDRVFHEEVVRVYPARDGKEDYATLEKRADDLTIQIGVLNCEMEVLEANLHAAREMIEMKEDKLEEWEKKYRTATEMAAENEEKMVEWEKKYRTATEMAAKNEEKIVEWEKKYRTATEIATKNEKKDVEWKKKYQTAQLLVNRKKNDAILPKKQMCPEILKATEQSIKEEKGTTMLSLQTALMSLPITVAGEDAARAFAKSVGNGRNAGMQSVVVLYIPRGKVYSPGFELFQLQLATYLRMCGIRHTCQIVTTDEVNKVPVMSIGGKDLFQPEICCAVIKECFYRQVKIQVQMLYAKKISLTTVKHILQTIIVWGLLIWQWIHNEGKTMQIIPQSDSVQFSLDLKKSLNTITKEKMKNWSKKMLFREVSKGIKSLSEELGIKNYFSGPLPGETDASAFVLLSQLLWNCEGSPFEKELSKYENLMTLVGRIKQEFWSEWEIGSALPHSWN